MALLITTASSAALSGIAPADQPGADSAAGSAGDAFAGVLAGIAESDGRPGRDASTRDQSGDAPPETAKSRSEAHRPAESTGADQAILAMLTPAMPAATVALIGSTVAPQPAVTAGSSAVSPDGTSQAAAGAFKQAGAPVQTAVASVVAARAAAPAAGSVGTVPASPQGLASSGSDTGVASATGAVPGTAPGFGSAPAPVPSKASDRAKAAPALEPDGATRAPAAANPVSGTAASTAPVPASVTGPAGAMSAGAPGPAVVALNGSAAAPASTPATAPSTPATAVHAPHRRSGRAPAGSGSQPATPGERATEVPVGTGAPVSAAIAAPAGTSPAPAGDLSVQAAHTRGTHPVAAGQPAGPGSEPARPGTELPLARQVAGPVLALRAGGDGSHQLIVALHPAELGPVNVHVRIQGDLMTIQLASTSETAHDALRNALPQLRAELQSAGLSSASVSVDLTSGGPGGGLSGSGPFAHSRQDAGEPGRPAGAVLTAEPTPTALRHRGTAGRTSTYSSAGLDRWL